MEDLWKGIHQSSLPGFVARGSIPIPFTLKDNEKHVDDEKNEMSKKELLNSLNTPGFISSLNSPFEALATTVAVSSSASSLLSTTCFSSVKNKRVSKDKNIFDAELGVNRRHKRMMKNRESAARSRARRQAYTTELEREHAELKEENAKLRKRQQMLLLSVSNEVSKKRTHSRSSTAPL